MKSFMLLLFCLLLAAIGAVGGWLAHGQASSDETPAAHPADAGPKVIPKQTLANLGVTEGALAPGSFTRTRGIPAVIERAPLSERPVFALLGGRVRDVSVEPGMLVTRDQTLLTIVRDPIPRTTLTFTEGILKPAHETVHEAAIELRKTHEEVAILTDELNRVKEFAGSAAGGDVVIPRQRVIDLENKARRARSANTYAKLELKKHGFTSEHIEEIQSGGHLPHIGAEVWRRALEFNGLWPDAAKQLFAVLPERQRGMQWVVGTVGELAAGGLITSPLIAWLKDAPDDCAHFLDIAALLQRGHSVAELKILHAAGGLDPVIAVKAPSTGPADWDVGELDVRPGAHVEAGSRLLTLIDATSVRLKTEPEGSEKTDLLKALADDTGCSARPLVDGAGPVRPQVALTFVTGGVGEAVRAYATLSNEPVAVRDHDGRKFRTWALRPGLRYVLDVPVLQMTNVYPLPASAVTSDGPHKVVFMRRGVEFKPVKVQVLYEDEKVVVLPADDREGNLLAPGNVIAMTGAYALGLALEDRPQAGHGHPH